MGLLNILQFSSEVEQNIDDNNDFLRIDPKMSMILILWSSERLVVHPWLKVITIDSPARSMAPMVCLHGSCFA